MRIMNALLAAGIIAAAALTSGSAFAQIGCPIYFCPGIQPCIGTIYTCYFNGLKTVTPPASLPPFGSSGFAQFRVVGYTCNPCGLILVPVTFTSSGNSPQLGNVNTTLAPSTSSNGGPYSFITALDPGNSFPARVEINLPLEARVDAFGTQTFRSQGVLKLTGTTTELPLRGVNVNQEGSLSFTNSEGQSFNLSGVGVTITSDPN